MKQLMSNIYLKVTIETLSNFDFLGLKNLSPGQFWGAPAKNKSKMENPTHRFRETNLVLQLI